MNIRRLVFATIVMAVAFPITPRRPLQTVPGVATSKCTSPSVVKLVVA